MGREDKIPGAAPASAGAALSGSPPFPQTSASASLNKFSSNLAFHHLELSYAFMDLNLQCGGTLGTRCSGT